MDLLFETLNIVRKSWDSQSALDFLLENNDPLSALDLIEELRDQLNSLPEPSHISENEDILMSESNSSYLYSNLANSHVKSEKLKDNTIKINCLENFWSYLNDKQASALRLLKDRFINMIVCDSQIHLKDQVDPKTALIYLQEEDSQNIAKLAEANTESSVLNQLNPIVVSLLSNQQFISTLNLATESLIEGLQNKIYNILMHLLSCTVDSKRKLPKELSDWENSEIGHKIKGVSFDIFLEIITVTYYHIVLGFRKMRNTQTHVQNLMKNINSPGHNDNVSFDLSKKSDILDNKLNFNQSELTREMTLMTQSIFDFSQSRCSHFLELRSSANIQLGLNDFYRLYQLAWHCIRHLEFLSGRSAAILRSSVITQTHSFFQYFHDEKMKYLALNISSDTWATSPVAIEYQYIASMLQHAMHHETNHPDFFFTSQTDQQKYANNQKSLEKAVNRDQLMIEGTEYHVSISGLALLKMVGDYLRCALNLPSVTNDVSTRIVLLIENFNNQVCQAVLGAGAMRTAGLNRISARHISLASQTLAMTLALLPGLRRCLELALGPEKLVLAGQLDRVTNDLAEHQSQLHSKLVSILADRASVHLGRMQKVDWEMGEEEKSDEEQVSTYMKDLVNDVQSLHRIMNRYLKPRETQQIVTKVNQDYVAAVERAIKTLPIHSPKAKRRLLRDVQYLISGLSTLPTQVANLHHLEVVVNDISF